MPRILCGPVIIIILRALRCGTTAALLQSCCLRLFWRPHIKPQSELVLQLVNL